MPAVWPGSLPQTVSWQGYQRRLQDTRIRSTMDAGPPKVRSRYSTLIVEHDLPVQYFTKTQWSTLETFYRTTLGNGALPFEWTDPITSATVNFRFVKPPVLGAMLGPDTIPVTLTVEVIP